MEKRVRVCDSCEVEENILVACDVCGKEYCENCLVEKGWFYFCPTHYKEVKEHIEGMKAGVLSGITRTWEDFRAWWEKESAKAQRDIDLYASVPEKPKEEWRVDRVGGEYRVNHTGTDVAGWASDQGACRLIQLVPEAANALYEHIRRERGKDS